MRTAKITIDGVEHTLCFSGRAMRACTERYGDISKINEALNVKSEKDQVKAMDEAVWLLAIMMDAGARYEKLQGRETPAPLSYDDLYDLVDVPDLSSMRSKVIETINLGKAATIEALPGKDGATPADIPAH